MEQRMMTFEEQESMRKAAMDEVGTEPLCPFCGKPRVSRSSYIRCNPCGVNWSPGEDITKNPRSIKTIVPTKPDASDTAQTAKSTTESA